MFFLSVRLQARLRFAPPHMPDGESSGAEMTSAVPVTSPDGRS